MATNPRDSLQAVAAVLFADADQLITRLEVLQNEYPQLILNLSTQTNRAAETIRDALTEIDQQSAPALLQALQQKAREAHAQMIATVADTARDSAAQALRSESGVITTTLQQLLAQAQAMARDLERNPNATRTVVTLLAAWVGAVSALLVVWIVIGLR